MSFEPTGRLASGQPGIQSSPAGVTSLSDASAISSAEVAKFAKGLAVGLAGAIGLWAVSVGGLLLIV